MRTTLPRSRGHQDPTQGLRVKTIQRNPSYGHPEGISPTPTVQTSGKNDKLTWPPSSQPLAVLCLALHVGIMLPGHWNVPGWPLGKQTLARNKVPDRTDKRTMSLGSKQPFSIPHRKGEWEQSCDHENQSHLSRETKGSQMPGRQLGLRLLTWGNRLHMAQRKNITQKRYSERTLDHRHRQISPSVPTPLLL